MVAILAPLAFTVLLVLLPAPLVLMVTIPLRQALLNANHAPLPPREMAPNNLLVPVRLALLVTLPLVVAPLAFAASKAPGRLTTLLNASSALLVRLV